MQKCKNAKMQKCKNAKMQKWKNVFTQGEISVVALSSRPEIVFDW